MKINFRIKNEKNNFLYKILNGMGIENYKWNILEDDIYNIENLQSFFGVTEYDGQTFKEKIKNNIYYIVFVEIIGKSLNSEDIIKITIVDQEFVDIETSKQQIIDIIKENIIKNGFIEE